MNQAPFFVPIFYIALLMELIFIFARLMQYLFIAPIWWLASGLAAYVFPVEGDSKQDALALLLAVLLSAGLITLAIYLL